jgi:hypothetical protein
VFNLIHVSSSHNCMDVEVAVGTTVTRCPPHRSVRAALPHTAPASGDDAKAGYGEGIPVCQHKPEPIEFELLILL